MPISLADEGSNGTANRNRASYSVKSRKACPLLHQFIKFTRDELRNSQFLTTYTIKMFSAGANGQMIINNADQMQSGANTTVITINGQNTVGVNSACIDNSVTIDKTFPPILVNRLSASSYSSFCDEIDRVLEPMSKITKDLAVTNLVTFVIFIGALALFLVITLMDFFETFIRLILIFGICALGSILSIYGRKLFASRQQDVINNLEQVCTRKSTESQQISFQLNTNQTFEGFTRRGRARINSLRVLSISINVSPNAAAAAMDGFATTIMTPGGTSTAQRLQELEGIKSVITEQEYQEKRRAILNTL